MGMNSTSISFRLLLSSILMTHNSMTCSFTPPYWCPGRAPTILLYEFEVWAVARHLISSVAMQPLIEPCRQKRTAFTARTEHKPEKARKT